MVLAQYAIGNGPINVVNVWTQESGKTRELFQDICNRGIIGFNLAFDWYHITKFWHMIRHLGDEDRPIDHIPSVQRDYVYYDNCVALKPSYCVDLYLHSLSTNFQVVMERKPVNIRKIPEEAANKVIEFLNKLEWNPLLFARSQGKAEWKIKPSKSSGFVDIYLNFKPSAGLKSFAKYILKLKTVKLEDEVWDSPDQLMFFPGQPYDLMYTDWEDANLLEYAYNDIVLTRELDTYFNFPEQDTNSVLACMIATNRFTGYNVDLPGIRRLKEESDTASKLAIEYNTVAKVKDYISDGDPLIRELLVSTSKKNLEKLASNKETDCVFCQPANSTTYNNLDDDWLQSNDKSNVSSGGNESRIDKCIYCNNGKVTSHVAVRASDIISSRSAQKESEMYAKILLARRLHASLRTVGALSNRMSGTDNLNVQAIKKTKKVRKVFQFGRPGYVMQGGDFDSYEVGIAAAFFNDEKLSSDIRAGKSIHTIFGTFLYNIPYDEVVKSKGTTVDYYTMAKSCVFALIYGGNIETLITKGQVSRDSAELGYLKFTTEYPGVGIARNSIFSSLTLLIQENTGGKVEFNKRDKDYVQDFVNGWRRYFTVEFSAIENLYNILNSEEFRQAILPFARMVRRREKDQLASSAILTAIYAAMFNIQSQVQRAGANHVIQSTGAGMCKELQRKLWELQPTGIHEWIIQPMNIHDEILACVREDYQQQTKDIVAKFILDMKSYVPEIGMEWKTMSSWAEK